MRITKRMCENLVSQLASELKTPFRLEDASIKGEGKTRFNLFKVTEHGSGFYHLNYPKQYTARELYDALRLTLDILRFSELVPKGEKT